MILSFRNDDQRVRDDAVKGRRKTKVAVLAMTWLGLCVVTIGTASAVPAYIDRTGRTIDVPHECLVAPNYTNAVRYDNLVVDARFTLVLSTTAHLKTRGTNTELDLSWYHFAPGNPGYNQNLYHRQRLIRAFTMMRCGLPVAQGDDNLYQYPADNAARTAFLQFAMGDGGAEARVPTHYTLIEDGERDALLMYAARRIKFDLTPTMVGRDRVCLLYSRAGEMSGCSVDRAVPDPQDVMIGYLYEGMNRVSYTGHEFWMMFDIAAYRNKVFFTKGDQMANGNQVDTFLAWDNANRAIVLWHDNNGVQTTYPGAPYQFQGIYDANNNSRAFFQNLLSAFLTTYNPRIVTFAQ